MPLTNEWIKEQLEICEKAVPPGQLVRSADARFIAAAREGYPLVLKEVMRLRKQRCETCHFFHYDDLGNEWLCSFRITDNMPDWYCANWKPREEAADASTD